MTSAEAEEEICHWSFDVYQEWSMINGKSTDLSPLLTGQANSSAAPLVLPASRAPVQRLRCPRRR